MNLETDAVPGTVPEELPELRRFDDMACGAIDFLRFDPGTTRVPVAGPDGMTMIAVGARRGSYEPRGPF